MTRRLPEVCSFVARLRAEGPQRLPPLPTTSLHGALGHALRRAVCVDGGRASCEGCHIGHRCAYVGLVAPRAPAGRGLGVTDRAPSPLVLSPETALNGQRWVELAAGETLGIRLTLIGRAVFADAALVRKALERAAGDGLGVAPEPTARTGARPGLRLAGWEAAGPPCATDRPPCAATLEFLTPVRLVAGGHIASRLDGHTLVHAVFRRADLLAQLYGAGRLDPLPEAARTLLDVDDSRLRLMRVRRYSSRQRRHMEWPGLVGELRVSGPGLAPLWPLLRFCEEVHIGKATSFGFGRFVLRSLQG